MNYEFICGKSILDSDCQALVNPVNCQGVMGKGLALAFKKRFPDNFKNYKQACETGSCRIGHCYNWKENDEQGFGPMIINFPTKDKWRNPSDYGYIEAGMIDLCGTLERIAWIRRIAFPMLGCGNGGLDPDNVVTIILSSLMENLGTYYRLDVELYK